MWDFHLSKKITYLNYYNLPYPYVLKVQIFNFLWLVNKKIVLTLSSKIKFLNFFFVSECKNLSGLNDLSFVTMKLKIIIRNSLGLGDLSFIHLYSIKKNLLIKVMYLRDSLYMMGFVLK